MHTSNPRITQQFIQLATNRSLLYQAQPPAKRDYFCCTSFHAVLFQQHEHTQQQAAPRFRCRSSWAGDCSPVHKSLPKTKHPQLRETFPPPPWQCQGVTLTPAPAAGFGGLQQQHMPSPGPHREAGSLPGLGSIWAGLADTARKVFPTPHPPHYCPFTERRRLSLRFKYILFITKISRSQIWHFFFFFF